MNWGCQPTLIPKTDLEADIGIFWFNQALWDPLFSVDRWLYSLLNSTNDWWVDLLADSGRNREILMSLWTCAGWVKCRDRRFYIFGLHGSAGFWKLSSRNRSPISAPVACVSAYYKLATFCRTRECNDTILYLGVQSPSFSLMASSSLHKQGVWRDGFIGAFQLHCSMCLWFASMRGGQRRWDATIFQYWKQRSGAQSAVSYYRHPFLLCATPALFWDP